MAVRTQLSPAVLLLDGQTALRQGRKDEARACFRAVLDLDPQSEDAWLWLSGTVDPPEAMRCLQRVLQINPDNDQAHEGLAWLEQNFADEHIEPLAPAVSDAPEPMVDERRAPNPAARVTGVQADGRGPTASPADDHALGSLIEAAAHVLAIGALLGLASLALALRATALFVGRGERGPLAWSGAVGLALVAALTHGAALLLSWWILGGRLARLRNDHRGDLFRSLLEASRAMRPGYLVAPGLGIMLLGVGWSEQRWIPILVVTAVLLGLALVSSTQRVVRLRAPLRMSRRHERQLLVGLLGPSMVGGAVTLTGATLLVRLLLLYL